jgi:hypothetical protein
MEQTAVLVLAAVMVKEHLLLAVQAALVGMGFQVGAVDHQLGQVHLLKLVAQEARDSLEEAAVLQLQRQELAQVELAVRE